MEEDYDNFISSTTFKEIKELLEKNPKLIYTLKEEVLAGIISKFNR